MSLRGERSLSGHCRAFFASPLGHPPTHTHTWNNQSERPELETVKPSLLQPEKLGGGQYELKERIGEASFY